MEKIKEQKQILKELREEENRLKADLSDYLNQTEESGILIDDHRVIKLAQSNKKINKSAKTYKTYLVDLCQERGLPDEEFVTAILDGKVENTVQQQKIKIVKIK